MMRHWTEFDINNYNLDTFVVTKKKDYTVECNNILTFDIEVSSGFMDPETSEIEGYKSFMSDEYWKSKVPVSLCYIWQFSFDDDVYYGRELNEFYMLLSKLPSNVHFIIYVHNLAYEFQFLNNIFNEWESVFARNAHKVMKCSPKDFPKFEFRCSYFLTRKSLENWGKEVGTFKKTGDLDYNIVRTPKTELTDEEMGYCEFDCRVVFEGIKKYREKYKNVCDIPLTQTGEVRMVVKRKVKANKTLQRHLVKLLPQNADDYAELKQAFAGGYTHANFIHAGHTIYSNEGVAFDFASSYPTVMCSEKFPMQVFTKCKFDTTKFDDYAYLILIKLKNVEPKTFNHYLSIDKCQEIKKYVSDNGRVIRCEECVIRITEADFQILEKTYNFDYEILECKRSRKSYLPKEIVGLILYYYNNKTQYKGLPDKESIYRNSKEFINSIYGMMVTDLLQDEFEYENGEWKEHLKTTADVNECLADLIFDNRGRTFTSYAWGVWITAYARKNLWDCLLQCDSDVIYCDTDSLKIRCDQNYDWYNKRIQQKINDCLDFHGIDRSLATPVDSKGIPHPLGRFEREDDWTEFKTLGAKRYCYRTKKDGELHLTVSGIAKSAVLSLKDDIENFNETTIFDKDYFQQFKIDCENGKAAEYNTQYAGLTFDEICDKFKVKDGTKKMVTYVENPTGITWNKGCYDEYVSNELYGINMRNTSYTMGLSADFLDLLMMNSLNHLKCIK